MNGRCLLSVGSLWVVLAACAPPSRKVEPKPESPSGIASTDAEPCRIQGSGVCGDIVWTSPVTAQSEGVFEIQWRNPPPPHRIETRLTMDCCGSVAPCRIVSQVVDASVDRVSGIHVTAGDWTLLLRVLAEDGAELARTELRFGL